MAAHPPQRPSAGALCECEGECSTVPSPLWGRDRRGWRETPRGQSYSMPGTCELCRLRAADTNRSSACCTSPALPTRGEGRLWHSSGHLPRLIGVCSPKMCACLRETTYVLLLGRVPVARDVANVDIVELAGRRLDLAL